MEIDEHPLSENAEKDTLESESLEQPLDIEDPEGLEESEETKDELDDSNDYKEKYEELQRKETEREVTELFGDLETYKQVSNWAAENLNQEDIEMYNLVMEDGEEVHKRFALRGLNALHKLSMLENKTQQTPPAKLNMPKTKPSVSGFRSEAEMLTAMNDPRYRTDNEYRKSVERKVHNSTF